MSFSISQIQGPILPEAVKPATKSAPTGEFASALESAVQQVEGSRQNANVSIQQLLNGEHEELHNTIISTQKAELEFEMFMQVRNKVVNAYQEIMKMQV